MSMGGVIWGLVSMGEFGRAEFDINIISLTTKSIGTIHSRRQHFKGEIWTKLPMRGWKGSKIS